MKATVLIGGWVWGERAYQPDDVVDAPEPQVEAWEVDGYVKRLPLNKQRQAEPETATAEPDGEQAVERRDWDLNLEPKEYLKRFPDGPNADLARSLVEADDAG